jgi:flagellar protein FlaG
MEVRNVSQGGQASFDNVTKVDKSTTTEAQTVHTPIAATAQSQGTQKNETNSVSEKELKVALDKLSKFIEDDNTQIEYQYHSKFNDLMIKIINKDTKEVILEVPPRKILDLVAKMMEMVGVLFDKKA